MPADPTAVHVRCDGCGYWRPTTEIVLTFLHTQPLRYCGACDRARVHHPDEVAIAGRPA